MLEYRPKKSIKMCLGVWSKSGLQHKKKQQGKGSTLINFYGIPCTLCFQYSIWMNIKCIQTVFFSHPSLWRMIKFLYFHFIFPQSFKEENCQQSKVWIVFPTTKSQNAKHSKTVLVSQNYIFSISIIRFGASLCRRARIFYWFSL